MRQKRLPTRLCVLSTHLICAFFSLSCFGQQRPGTPANNDNTKTLSIRSEPGDIATDSTTDQFSLYDCLKYASKKQPAINQAYIDEQIARTNNGIALSGWLPQVNGSASVNGYTQSAPIYTNASGAYKVQQNEGYYTSVPSIGATQTIFSTDVLLAVRAAKLNTLAAKQNIDNVRIQMISDVSKSFYDLLQSVEQVRVYKEDSARLLKNKDDTYHQYVSGITDKVDYMQAVISLNNTLAQLRSARETVQSKYAVLKQYMGYPPQQRFRIRYDTIQMLQDVYMDTMATLRFEKRIEYQQLQTTKRIQRESTNYYKLQFLPALSAYYNYNYQFENSTLSQLYSNAYPYSTYGLQLSIPIFTGLRRLENIHRSHLEEERIDWDEVNLELTIYTQYKQALANYKSSLANMQENAENVKLAREVYEIVDLQYHEGIKAYLDLIVAESDLISAEIAYISALYQTLESKIDLEKAMGDIPPAI
jgi:outer membrane protein TolC